MSHPGHSDAAATPPRGWASPAVREGTWLAGVMAVSLALACLALRVWEGSLRVPYFLDGDDTLSFAAGLKSLTENGWSALSLGSATAETLQALVLGALAGITGSPGAAMNLFLLLSYPAIAAATWLVLRRVGASRLAAAVAAVLFALAPYQFAQASLGHLMLAAYVAVPLAGWLVLRALLGQPLFVGPARSPARGARAWITRRNVLMALVIVIIGSTGVYYAAFAVLLLGAAAILRGVVSRAWRAALPPLGAAVAIGAVTLVNLIPFLASRSTAPSNTNLWVRRAVESEFYSLSLTQLLVPVEGHRIGALAGAHDSWAVSRAFSGERGNQLGIILAITFVCGLVAVCAFALQARAGAGPRRRLAASASVAALVALLIGTFGGVSSLIAVYLSPQIRTWSRITIFIAFFAAVLLVLAIDWFIAWMKRRTGDARPAVALVLVLGLAGFLDQAPPAVAPDHAKDARTWQQGAQFISQMEAAVPPGSMILQLPYVPYPEAWLGKPLGPYDHFTGYLHSDSLRWSFGAMRGSAADWHGRLASDPPSVAIDAAAAAGFAGVYVDLAGYEDDGRAVRQAVDAAVGRPVAPIVSPDGRREFFSLAGARENLTARLGSQRVEELARSVAPPPG